MIHLFTVTFKKDNQVIKQTKIKENHSILRAAKQAHIPLRHRCGGKAQCTTCKVIVEDASSVTSPSQLEQDLLGYDFIQQHYRLSCQTRLISDTTILLPGDPYKERIKQLIQAQKEADSFFSS